MRLLGACMRLLGAQYALIGCKDVREDRLGGVNPPQTTSTTTCTWGGLTGGTVKPSSTTTFRGGYPPQRQGIQEYVLRGVNRGTAVRPQSMVQRLSMVRRPWSLGDSTYYVGLSADRQYCYGGLTGGCGSTLGGVTPPHSTYYGGLTGGQSKSDHYYYYAGG